MNFQHLLHVHALFAIVGLPGFPCADAVVKVNIPYYTTSDLGNPNDNAASGNPLKGFLTSPDWSTPPYRQEIPSSLEFYYVGLNEVMTGSDDFDWDTSFEPMIAETASRNKHAIVRFRMDCPGETTMVPEFLVDNGLVMNSYSTYGGGQSPDYTDSNLLQALQGFIAAFGARYDGDTRIGFIQVGLLGFWGEWHTYTDGSGLTEGWIPSSTKDLIVGAFESAFSITQLQVRYPHQSAVDAGFGLHDDSFAHSTLDGAANGGVVVDWFFWPEVQNAGITDFWKNSTMGSELRPDLQSSIFSDTYTIGEYKQDFDLCVNTTHATYCLNYFALASENGYSGNDLSRAIDSNNRMGYSFRVTSVSVSEGNAASSVDVAVTIAQFGVAPFYYPLELTLTCQGGGDLSLPGVETIISQGDVKIFTFVNLPATPQCLDDVSITLTSSFAYLGNPVKFAQGLDGRSVNVALPLPSLAPSPAPPSCDQNDSDIFYRKRKGVGVSQTCNWLRTRKRWKWKRSLCRATAEGSVDGVLFRSAGEVCFETCEYLKRFRKGSRNKTCNWLRKKNKEEILKICGDYEDASDTCYLTCKTCPE